MTHSAESFGQEMAQVSACDTLPFAKGSLARHTSPTHRGKSLDTTCYHFPSNWPDRFAVGPFFCAAVRGKGQEKTLQNAVIAVESETIITKRRGTSCGNSWQSPFWSCLWRAVLITIFSAVCWARARALHWSASRAAVLALVRFWAVCSERSATTSIFAGRVTKTAFGQRPFIWKRPNGHSARLAFFRFGPRPQ